MWQTLACSIVRPKQVRWLTYPEHVQKAWGFSFAGGAMRIRRVSVLIDGGFFLKRLPKIVERNS